MLKIVKGENGGPRVKAEYIAVGRWFLGHNGPRMRVEWGSGHAPTYTSFNGEAVDTSGYIVGVDQSGRLLFTCNRKHVTPIKFVNQLEYVIDD